ncbi:hypothetical protein TIFTF001_050619 [Ficus carica]|uniref:Uncharacterized protein n=1 Tax=Ficus carica TaxID=3494 RepID=A0AA88CTM3_FICCA|nr:hypothetical protein TIFTF001_050619 [Ficus carica]
MLAGFPDRPDRWIGQAGREIPVRTSEHLCLLVFRSRPRSLAGRGRSAGWSRGRSAGKGRAGWARRGGPVRPVRTSEQKMFAGFLDDRSGRSRNPGPDQ